MSKFRDLTGLRFGKLVVVNRVPLLDADRSYWCCLCDCGNYKDVRASNLVGGITKSCGCSSTRLIDLTGKRFGSLTVVRRVMPKKGWYQRATYWECLCDCGNTTVTRSRSLLSGATKSCGCTSIERRVKAYKKTVRERKGRKGEV